MARKKQEVQLQQEIESQEEWEEMLGREGLTVVDIYQEWCGPCKAMASNFRRIKNELGDDLLKFAVAKADTIDALERYRGRCEPCFLFIASGSLVAVERGARSPYILRTLTEQLAREHKVLEGSAERIEIKDPLLAAMEEKEKESKDEEETERDDDDEEPVKKEVTVAILKPDVIQAGRAEEVLEQIQAAGIEILADEERKLTDEEARELYSHLEGEEFFEDLIQFVTSGTSRVLVLTKGKTGENIIAEWRELLGPTNVEEAKEQAPESLRSKFGDASFKNALHGSDSKDSAARELAFFFPEFTVPNVPGTGRKLQRTVALVRPEAVALHKDAIVAKIEEAGFTISFMKEVQLTKEQAEDFYREHKEQDYFDELTTRMSNGPLLALALAREDAVNEWRKCLGPKEKEKLEEEPDSFRAKFDVPDTPFNALHGSDSVEAAKREMELIFPMQQTLAVIKPDALATKDEIIDKIHEAGFKIAARKETQLTREFVELMYPDQRDKEFFNDLSDFMISGPTLFMVLSREDAVEGWRSLIGPTDPNVAKTDAPNTIRAQFGQDIRSNAVHGSSTVDSAKDAIKSIFDDEERIEEKKEETEETEQAGEGSAAQAEGQEQAEGEKPTEQEDAGEVGGETATEEQTEQEQTEQQEGDVAAVETEGSKPASPAGSNPGSPDAGSKPASASEEHLESGSKPASASGERLESESKPASPEAGDKPEEAAAETQKEPQKEEEGDQPATSEEQKESADKQETEKQPETEQQQETGKAANGEETTEQSEERESEKKTDEAATTDNGGKPDEKKDNEPEADDKSEDKKEN